MVSYSQLINKNDNAKTFLLLSSGRSLTLGSKQFAAESKSLEGHSPGGPVVKTLHPQCKGPRFDPWSGNWIPHGAAKYPACHNGDLAQPNK